MFLEEGRVTRWMVEEAFYSGAAMAQKLLIPSCSGFRSKGAIDTKQLKLYHVELKLVLALSWFSSLDL